MIIVKILGGMGNQMFQYAAASALAKHCGAELMLDTRSLKNHGERPFELHHFQINAKEANLKDYSQLGGGILAYPLIRLKKHSAYYLEKEFNFSPDFFNHKNNVYLDGYFQSERYFIDFRQEILSELSFKEELTSDEIFWQKKMATGYSISLHIRRGDYVTNKKAQAMLGTLPLDYYSNALADIKLKVKEPEVFIFSDDLGWAEDNLKLGTPAHFVQGHSGDQSFRDMRLMSFCNHHIIANSSFSWWGAYLNNKEGKLVLAPDAWFKNSQISTRDLIPQTWTRVSL